MSKPLFKREPLRAIRGMKVSLIRVRGGCEVCGESAIEKLHLHHKRYRPELEPSDVSLLCTSHHKLLHVYVSGRDSDLPRFTDVFIEGMKQEPPLYDNLA